MATEAEAALWEFLCGGRIRGFKFRRQHVIGPYIVDFYCAAARLVVEVDGPIHGRQIEADATRTIFLEQSGLRVLRVTNDQVLQHIAETRELIDRSLLASPSPYERRGGLRG